MSLMQVKIKLNLKLDRIMKAAEKNEQKMLMHVAGYIRKTAKNSMKSGKGKIVSQPGKPPFTWTRIYPVSLRYAWDNSKRVAIVGGIRLAKHADPVPGIIEYGGLRMLLNLKSGRFGVGIYEPRPALRLALKVAIKQAIGAAISGFVKP